MVKHIKNILIIFIGLVAAGYLALVCVYALPTDPILKNVEESAKIIKSEGHYYEVIEDRKDTRLDNFTDSLMLLTARYKKNENVFVEALLSNRMSAKDMRPSDILIAESQGEVIDGYAVSYERYWHGYLIYLKPLLLMLNYGEIRYLIGMVHFALLVGVIMLFCKKNKEIHILPFVVAYFYLSPVTISLSLQYLPATVVTMIQFILLLLNEEKYKKNPIIWIYHFFVVGCVIAYFDLLTFPLLTLGMPLAFLLVENKKSMKEGFACFIGSGISWASGYVMMWGSKWILTTVITGKNIMKSVFGQIMFRVGVSQNNVETSVKGALTKNININKDYLVIAMIIIAILILIKLKENKIKLKNVNVNLLMCAILPFVWYVFISNHSEIHCFFTYRNLSIAIYTIMLFVIGQLDYNRKEKM